MKGYRYKGSPFMDTAYDETPVKLAFLALCVLGNPAYAPPMAPWNWVRLLITFLTPLIPFIIFSKASFSWRE